MVSERGARVAWEVQGVPLAAVLEQPLGVQVAEVLRMVEAVEAGQVCYPHQP